jgi:hypothetical protein
MAEIRGDYRSQNAQKRVAARFKAQDGAARMYKMHPFSGFEGVLQVVHPKFAGLVHIGAELC